MRILFALLMTLPLWAAPPQFQMRETATPGGVSMKHVVYVPDQLDPDRRYPFTIYLHGYCPECTTHERILRESGLQFWHGYDRNVQKEPTFLLAPVGGGDRWTTPARRKALFEIIDGLMKEFPIDPQRIYIMGFSMGAAGAWDFLQFRPNFFAAANPQAIGGGDVNPELVKKIPIWATIGAKDQPARVEQLTVNVAKIRAVNGDSRGADTSVMDVNPRFTVFPETGHGEAQGATQRIPALLDWFYAQRR